MLNNSSIRQKFLVKFGVILLIFVISGVINYSKVATRSNTGNHSSALAAFAASAADANMKHQPIVEELIRILEVKPELKEALEESIRRAERLDAPTLAAYIGQDSNKS